MEADRFALELGARYEKLQSLVAGGTLAVSVTFIEKLAPHPIPGSRWVALAGWSLLGVSLVSSLVAVSQSQNAIQKKIENLDTEILQRLYPNDERYQGIVAENPFLRRLQLANGLSLWATVIGLSCIILFAFLNLSKQRDDEFIKTVHSTPNSSTGIASSAPDTSGVGDLRADRESSSSTAPSTDQQEQVTMANSNPNSPPLSPPKPMTETRGSYVPTQNQVPPPPPPSPAPKEK